MPFGSFAKRFEALTGNVEPIEVFVTVRPAGQGGDYDHVWQAVDGETPLAANTYLVIEVQGDWSAEVPDGIGLGLVVDDAKMGDGLYIEVRTDATNTFSGATDDSIYRLGSRIQSIESGDIRVYGCQITTAHNVCAEAFNGGNIRLERCALYGATDSGLQVTDAISSGFAINCIAYGFLDCGFNGWAPGVITCLFCTSADCGSRGFANTVNYNCIASDNTSQDFNGCTGDYNASTDATAPGANSIINEVFTFVDPDNGNYLLSSLDTSGAIGGGTSATTPLVPYDVTGALRPNPPSIGSSEPQTAVFVTVRPIGQGGDYTSMADALAGETPVVGAAYLVVEAQGDWSAGPDGDGSNLNITPVMLGDALYIEIRTDAANYFTGVVDADKYIANIQFEITAEDVRFRGIQCTGPVSCFHTDGSGFALFDRCVAYDASFSGFRADSDSSFRAINCLTYNITVERGFSSFSSVTPSAFFCNAINCNGQGFRGIEVYNCLASGSISDDDFEAGLTGDYNASSDGSAPGANSIINATFEFLDPFVNNYLLADIDLTGVIGGGLNTPSITVDVAGDARPNPPTIGFSEPKALLPGQTTSTNSDTAYGLQGNTGLPVGTFTIMYRVHITDWSDTPNAVQNVFAIGANDSNIYQLYSDMTAGTLRIWHNYTPDRLIYNAELFTDQWLTVGMRWAGGLNDWKMFVIDEAGVIYEQSYSPADSLHEFYMFGQAFAPENPQQLHGCTGIVYNGYMSDAQLLAQRQLDRPIASIDANVVGFYPMDDWTTAYVDQSGSGNNLNPNAAGTTVVDSPY